MKVLYCRVSTVEQKTDRQRVLESEFDLIIEDKCSGSIPFFERPGGSEILTLLSQNKLTSLHVWQIDRLGRNLRDIINTIHFFNERRITIYFVSQGLKTLDDNGFENPISKLMISILGIVGEMERSQIRERQLEGIKIAKSKGVYKGRKLGSKESKENFLQKEKNKKALHFLKTGYRPIQISKLLGLNLNTICKIRKIAFSDNACMSY